MTFKQIIFSLICSASALGATPDPSILKSVHLEIMKATQRDSLFHWKITNDLDTAVYAYDFYLWGPAYHVERSGNRLVIETTPISEEASCPPNRFPPVLLLVIGPHRTIEGDFSDPEIREMAGKIVALRVAVGADPYSVVAEAKKFMSSGCTHNPYDAIVRWGTILESNTLKLSPETGSLHRSGLQVIHTEKPVYPPLARVARVFGTVEVQVTVKGGIVTATEVKSGPPISPFGAFKRA